MDAIISSDSPDTGGGGDAPRKPLVNSFDGYVSYSMSFFFAIMTWFVAGAGIYDLLSRVSAMYILVYVIWAVPIVGMFACIFTGADTTYWRGNIAGWTWFVIVIQAVRTLFYGFRLETSPLQNFYTPAAQVADTAAIAAVKF